MIVNDAPFGEVEFVSQTPAEEAALDALDDLLPLGPRTAQLFISAFLGGAQWRGDHPGQGDPDRAAWA